MNESTHLPDSNRLSVLAAVILLAYALAPFVEMPPFDIEFTVLGVLVSFPMNFQTGAILLAAALAAAGMDWLVSDHPARLETAQASRGERFLAPRSWLLPALTAGVIGVPLATIAQGPQWWVVFVMGGALLALVFTAEYVALDPADIHYPAAVIGLTALSFALFLILVIALRSAGVRLYMLLPLLVPAATLVSQRTLFLRLGGRWSLPWGAAVALAVGQFATGLHYLPVSPVEYGLLAVGLLYGLTSLAAVFEEHRPLRSGAVEPALMTGVMWALAVWLR